MTNWNQDPNFNRQGIQRHRTGSDDQFRHPEDVRPMIRVKEAKNKTSFRVGDPAALLPGFAWEKWNHARRLGADGAQEYLNAYAMKIGTTPEAVLQIMRQGGLL